MKNYTSLYLMLLSTFAFPTIVSAHTGISPVTGFSTGIFHPLSGADHILAMFSVGL